MRHYFAETSFLLVNASMPTFDEDGILNGIGVVDCIYLPDEVTIDGETIVSDALVGYRKAQEFRIQQEFLNRSSRDYNRLANKRYKGGVTSYLAGGSRRRPTAFLSRAFASAGTAE